MVFLQLANSAQSVAAAGEALFLGRSGGIIAVALVFGSAITARHVHSIRASGFTDNLVA